LTDRIKPSYELTPIPCIIKSFFADMPIVNHKRNSVFVPPTNCIHNYLIHNSHQPVHNEPKDNLVTNFACNYFQKRNSIFKEIAFFSTEILLDQDEGNDSEIE